jgi:signal peptidase I
MRSRVANIHQDDINNGMVPTAKITGKVVGVIWPIKNIDLVDSYSSLK